MQMKSWGALALATLLLAGCYPDGGFTDRAGPGAPVADPAADAAKLTDSASEESRSASGSEETSGG